MISWKHSFNRLSEEYEIAKKKQQALDGLYEKGRISQSTHDSYNNEIASTIAEIEKQQQDLVAKMAMKTAELQGQIKTLEMLLANYEIQHVTGEIDDVTYTQEINLFNNGLETAKHELQTIQDAMNQLCQPVTANCLIPEPAPPVEAAPASIPECIEVPATPPPAELTPSYIVSAPEPIITSVAEAVSAPAIEVPAPEQVIETPSPIAESPAPVPEPAPVAVVESSPAADQSTLTVEPPAVEAPVAESQIAAPEPAPVPIEAPAALEQPAPVVEALPVEVPAVEAPVAEPPVAEQPIVEAAPAEAAPVEVPIVEASVAETPAIETPIVEAPKTEASIVDAPIVEAPAESPTIVEATPTPVEAVVVIEEPKEEKAALDEFEVTEPDAVQKELVQSTEEVAESPLSQAPPEAHEEAAKVEGDEEKQPIVVQAAKETSPEASSNSENKE